MWEEEEGVDGEEERRSEGEAVPLPERERDGEGNEAARRSNTPSAACIYYNKKRKGAAWVSKPTIPGQAITHPILSTNAGREPNPPIQPTSSKGPLWPWPSPSPCGWARALAVMPSAARSQARRKASTCSSTSRGSSPSRPEPVPEAALPLGGVLC